MTNTKTTPVLTLRRALVLFVAVFAIAATVHAGGQGNRKLTMSNQNPSQTGVSYTFTINPSSTGSTIRRLEFQVGTAKGNTTVPTSMSTTGATLGTITGLSGSWSLNAASNGLLVITNASGSTPTNPVSVTFNNITNSSLTGTYFFRMTSFDATSGGVQIDTDDVAFPIANSTVSVTGYVSETISFSLSSTSLNLGQFTTSSIASGNHTMSVTTNATNGYTITGFGTTMTSGANTIPFVSDGAVTVGQREYGVAYSGAGGHPSGDVGLGTTTVVTSRSAPFENDTTTATYKVGINGTTAAGNYASNITYVAVSSF